MKECLLSTDKYKLNLFSSEQNGPVVLFITNESLEHYAEEIFDELKLITGFPFIFCELQVSDWDAFLTPWEVDFHIGERVFQGRAKELSDDIRDEIIPKLHKIAKRTVPVYVAGYSLAGLFSLWSLYESDLFDGAVCCSGSLWYPGWKEYAAQHILRKPGCVYLSLGKKEKNSKDSQMKTVEDNTILQYELLKNDNNVTMVKMDWNEGGHFSNIAERMVMGIRWILA